MFSWLSNHIQMFEYDLSFEFSGILFISKVNDVATSFFHTTEIVFFDATFAYFINEVLLYSCYQDLAIEEFEK